MGDSRKIHRLDNNDAYGFGNLYCGTAVICKMDKLEVDEVNVW